MSLAVICILCVFIVSKGSYYYAVRTFESMTNFPLWDNKVYSILFCSIHLQFLN